MSEAKRVERERALVEAAMACIRLDAADVFARVDATHPVDAVVAPSERDTLYDERARVVGALARAASSAGLRVGFGTDQGSPDWPVLYIDLPAGQVSWHFTAAARDREYSIAAYAGAWDGHDTTEKYARLAAWDGCGSAPPGWASAEQVREATIKEIAEAFDSMAALHSKPALVGRYTEAAARVRQHSVARVLGPKEGVK